MTSRPMLEPVIIELAGVTVEVPNGWEVRIRRSTETATGQDRTYPVLHAATVGLPNERGDYGSGVVELLGSGDAFVALAEYGPEAVGSALFPVRPMPRTITPERVHPRRLHRTLAGQAGVQVFFTDAGRAFCLYVVVGSFANRVTVLPAVDRLLAGISIDQ